MMQGIAVAHAAPRVEGLSARSLYSHRKRRKKHESWDVTSTPSVFPFVCLLAFPLACHQAVSPRETAAEVS